MWSASYPGPSKRSHGSPPRTGLASAVVDHEFDNMFAETRVVRVRSTSLNRDEKHLAWQPQPDRVPSWAAASPTSSGRIRQPNSRSSSSKYRLRAGAGEAVPQNGHQTRPGLPGVQPQKSGSQGPPATASQRQQPLSDLQPAAGTCISAPAPSTTWHPQHAARLKRRQMQPQKPPDVGVAQPSPAVLTNLHPHSSPAHAHSSTRHGPHTVLSAPLWPSGQGTPPPSDLTPSISPWSSTTSALSVVVETCPQTGFSTGGGGSFSSDRGLGYSCHQLEAADLFSSFKLVPACSSAIQLPSAATLRQDKLQRLRDSRLAGASGDMSDADSRAWDGSSDAHQNASAESSSSNVLASLQYADKRQWQQQQKEQPQQQQQQRQQRQQQQQHQQLGWAGGSNQYQQAASASAGPLAMAPSPTIYGHQIPLNHRDTTNQAANDASDVDLRPIILLPRSPLRASSAAQTASEPQPSASADPAAACSTAALAGSAPAATSAAAGAGRRLPVADLVRRFREGPPLPREERNRQAAGTPDQGVVGEHDQAAREPAPAAQEPMPAPAHSDSAEGHSPEESSAVEQRAAAVIQRSRSVLRDQEQLTQRIQGALARSKTNSLSHVRTVALASASTVNTSDAAASHGKSSMQGSSSAASVERGADEEAGVLDGTSVTSSSDSTWQAARASLPAGKTLGGTMPSWRQKLKAILQQGTSDDSGADVLAKWQRRMQQQRPQPQEAPPVSARERLRKATLPCTYLSHLAPVPGEPLSVPAALRGARHPPEVLTGMPGALPLTDLAKLTAGGVAGRAISTLAAGRGALPDQRQLLRRALASWVAADLQDTLMPGSEAGVWVLQHAPQLPSMSPSASSSGGQTPVEPLVTAVTPALLAPQDSGSGAASPDELDAILSALSSRFGVRFAVDAVTPTSAAAGPLRTPSVAGSMAGAAAAAAAQRGAAWAWPADPAAPVPAPGPSQPGSSAAAGFTADGSTGVPTAAAPVPAECNPASAAPLPPGRAGLGPPSAAAHAPGAADHGAETSSTKSAAAAAVPPSYIQYHHVGSPRAVPLGCSSGASQAVVSDLGQEVELVPPCITEGLDRQSASPGASDLGPSPGVTAGGWSAADLGRSTAPAVGAASLLPSAPASWHLLDDGRRRPPPPAPLVSEASPQHSPPSGAPSPSQEFADASVAAAASTSNGDPTIGTGVTLTAGAAGAPSDEAATTTAEPTVQLPSPGTMTPLGALPGHVPPQRAVSPRGMGCAHFPSSPQPLSADCPQPSVFPSGSPWAAPSSSQPSTAAAPDTSHTSKVGFSSLLTRLLGEAIGGCLFADTPASVPRPASQPASKPLPELPAVYQNSEAYRPDATMIQLGVERLEELAGHPVTSLVGPSQPAYPVPLPAASGSEPSRHAGQLQGMAEEAPAVKQMSPTAVQMAALSRQDGVPPLPRLSIDSLSSSNSYAASPATSPRHGGAHIASMLAHTVASALFNDSVEGSPRSLTEVSAGMPWDDTVSSCPPHHDMRIGADTAAAVQQGASLPSLSPAQCSSDGDDRQLGSAVSSDVASRLQAAAPESGASSPSADAPSCGGVLAYGAYIIVSGSTSSDGGCMQQQWSLASTAVPSQSRLYSTCTVEELDSSGSCHDVTEALSRSSSAASVVLLNAIDPAAQQPSPTSNESPGPHLVPAVAPSMTMPLPRVPASMPLPLPQELHHLEMHTTAGTVAHIYDTPTTHSNGTGRDAVMTSSTVLHGVAGQACTVLQAKPVTPTSLEVQPDAVLQPAASPRTRLQQALQTATLPSPHLNVPQPQLLLALDSPHQPSTQEALHSNGSAADVGGTSGGLATLAAFGSVIARDAAANAVAAQAAAFTALASAAAVVAVPPVPLPTSASVAGQQPVAPPPALPPSLGADGESAHPHAAVPSAPLVQVQPADPLLGVMVERQAHAAVQPALTSLSTRVCLPTVGTMPLFETGEVTAQQAVATTKQIMTMQLAAPAGLSALLAAPDPSLLPIPLAAAPAPSRGLPSNPASTIITSATPLAATPLASAPPAPAAPAQEVAVPNAGPSEPANWQGYTGAASLVPGHQHDNDDKLAFRVHSPPALASACAWSAPLGAHASHGRVSLPLTVMALPTASADVAMSLKTGNANVRPNGTDVDYSSGDSLQEDVVVQLLKVKIQSCLEQLSHVGV